MKRCGTALHEGACRCSLPSCPAVPASPPPLPPPPPPWLPLPACLPACLPASQEEHLERPLMTATQRCNLPMMRLLVTVGGGPAWPLRGSCAALTAQRHTACPAPDPARPPQCPHDLHTAGRQHRRALSQRVHTAVCGGVLGADGGGAPAAGAGGRPQPGALLRLQCCGSRALTEAEGRPVWARGTDVRAVLPGTCSAGAAAARQRRAVPSVVRLCSRGRGEGSVCVGGMQPCCAR